MSFLCSHRLEDGYQIPSFQIEKEVETYEKILQKDLLCRNDVKVMNHIWSTISDDVSKEAIIQLIIKKIEFFKTEPFEAKRLISFYHLQRFSGLPQSNSFSEMMNKLKKTAEFINDLVVNLPTCVSNNQFEQDAGYLIGDIEYIRDTHQYLSSNRSVEEDLLERANQIFKDKKTQIQRHHEKKLKEIIAERTLSLFERRAQDSKTYPAYLDQLLEKGLIHLFDHLMQMKAIKDQNQRWQQIKRMSFSEIAHVVLEARSSIISKVESSIPADLSKIVFLLGISGAGKSTTLCFLRGDHMRLNHDSYESVEDQSDLIGHQVSTSCTFLPNSACLDDWCIIDFSGFGDSHGPLVTLGIECALKMLITKYSPRILVLESINNTEGRYASTAALGRKLKDFVDNPHLIGLGTTKYFKDADFRELEAIEKQQRVVMIGSTKEEIKLEGIIEYLEDEAAKEPFRKKLETLKAQRANSLPGPLPETGEKIRLKQGIESKEQSLSQEIGLNLIVRFSHLEDQTHREACFRVLANLEPVIQKKPKQILDSEIRSLLKDLMKEVLIREIEPENNDSFNFKGVNEFKSMVLQSSLTKTLFAHSKPEIGEFFHLPEIDPTLVQEFDKEIVNDCIDNLIKAVLHGLSEMNCTSSPLNSVAYVRISEVEKLKEKIESLQRLILGYKGYGDQIKDSTKIQDLWKSLRAKTTRLEKQNFIWLNLMVGAIVCSWVPWTAAFALPLQACFATLYGLRSKIFAKVYAEINKHYKALDSIQKSLIALIEIKNIINNKKEIDDRIEQNPINMESYDKFLQSYEKQLACVQGLYGLQDWEDNISYLVERWENIFYEELNRMKLSSNRELILLSLLTYVQQDPSVYLLLMSQPQGDLDIKPQVLKALSIKGEFVSYCFNHDSVALSLSVISLPNGCQVNVKNIRKALIGDLIDAYMKESNLLRPDLRDLLLKTVESSLTTPKLDVDSIIVDAKNEIEELLIREILKKSILLVKHLNINLMPTKGDDDFPFLPDSSARLSIEPVFKLFNKFLDQHLRMNLQSPLSRLMLTTALLKLKEKASNPTPQSLIRKLENAIDRIFSHN